MVLAGNNRSAQGGWQASGAAGTNEHAEQTDAEKHQARRLGDGRDGDDAGGAVANRSAAAARDIDTTDVAGKPARSIFDEHLAAPPAAGYGGYAEFVKEGAAAAALRLKTAELESVTEAP